jgi:hypothetical protein
LNGVFFGAAVPLVTFGRVVVPQYLYRKNAKKPGQNSEDFLWFSAGAAGLG